MAISKFSKIFLFFLSVVFVFPLSSFAQNNTTEEIMTFETYYPAPFGVYNEMRSKRMAVGTNYYNASAYPWGNCTSTGGSTGTSNEICNADLVVEGNVGIGPMGLPVVGPGTLQLPADAGGLTISGHADSSPNRYFIDLHRRDQVEAGGGIRWRGNDNSILWQIAGQGAGASGIYFKEGTTDRVVIRNNGNVGIGTTAPTAMLEVAGGDASFAWGGDHSSNGYVRIGNVQICWGNGVAVDYPGYTNWYIKAATIQFPSGCQFKDNNYSLTATPTATSTNGKAFVGPYAFSRSTTSAWVLFHKISDTDQEAPTAEGPVPFTWMAIGTWK